MSNLAFIALFLVVIGAGTLSSAFERRGKRVTELAALIESLAEEKDHLARTNRIAYGSLMDIRDQNQHDPNFTLWAKTRAADTVKQMDRTR